MKRWENSKKVFPMYKSDLILWRKKLGDYEYVNWLITGMYTQQGCERWWHRPKAQLDNKTPHELWNENREKVIKFAEGIMYD